MHRLFNDRARSYILVDVKTNSKESSCAKKLFLYEFSLNMLSHMNYICIHFDISSFLRSFRLSVSVFMSCTTLSFS